MTVALLRAELGVASFPDKSILLSAKLIPIILQEIVIGVSAGMIVSIAFASVSLAGEKIAATSGLAFASQVDPAGTRGFWWSRRCALHIFCTAIIEREKNGWFS